MYKDWLMQGQIHRTITVTMIESWTLIWETPGSEQLAIVCERVTVSQNESYRPVYHRQLTVKEEEEHVSALIPNSNHPTALNNPDARGV